MNRIAVLCIGLSLVVFAGCVGKPAEKVENGTSDITPPTENQDIQDFFDYLEETIKKEEEADKQAALDAEAQKQAENQPAIIKDENFQAE